MKSPEEIISNLNVSVYHDPEVEYPDAPPYSPSIGYPEYILRDISQKENSVYEAVRKAMLLLGLDKDNFGTVL